MGNSLDKPFTFDRVIRIVGSVFLIAFGIYLIYILRDALLPFLVAWLIAYLLNPIVRFFQKTLRLKKRFVAVFVTFVFVLSVVVLFAVAITPMMEDEILQINNLISAHEFQSLNIHGLPTSVTQFFGEKININSLRSVLTKESALDAMKEFLPTLQSILSSSLSFILSLAVVFVVILYLIFILLDYDKINKLWMDLIPPKHRPFISKLAVDVERSMNNYFRHQAIICLIVGVLFTLGFQIVGLPLAIILGLMIAVLHMVPYLHIFSIIPVVLLCWLKVSQTGQSFWALLGVVMLIYVVIQCIIDLFLIPKIMGKAMGLNPAIILLSLSIWGSLMGVVGMIIAIPLTTLFLSYYQNYLNTISDAEAAEFAEKQERKLLKD